MGEIHARQLTSDSLSGTENSSRCCCRASRMTGRLAALSCSRRSVPGSYPYTAGVFAFQARGREDPTCACLRARAMPSATQSALQTGIGGHAGAPLVHGIRFRDPVRLGSRPAARTSTARSALWRVHRVRLDDMKVLYWASICRRLSTMSVSMTINGPGADDSRHVHEHRHRSTSERYDGNSSKLDAVIERYLDIGPAALFLDLPVGHEWPGLRLPGIPRDEAVDSKTYERIRA